MSEKEEGYINLDFIGAIALDDGVTSLKTENYLINNEYRQMK
jgi:hypothetical protein